MTVGNLLEIADRRLAVLRQLLLFGRREVVPILLKRSFFFHERER